MRCVKVATAIVNGIQTRQAIRMDDEAARPSLEYHRNGAGIAAVSKPRGQAHRDALQTSAQAVDNAPAAAAITKKGFTRRPEPSSLAYQPVEKCGTG